MEMVVYGEEAELVRLFRSMGPDDKVRALRVAEATANGLIDLEKEDMSSPEWFRTLADSLP